MNDPLTNPAPLVRRVYAYAAYRVGAGPDAEDITSETFERALRYRDSFDPRRGDALSWLLGIARRVITDCRGSEYPPVYIVGDWVESHESGSLRSIQLRAAMSVLGDRDREIVALRFGADLPAREIARALDMRVNTVEVALHRALALLRDQLGEAEASPAAIAAPAPNGS